MEDEKSFQNCFEDSSVEYPLRKVSSDDNDIRTSSLPGTKRSAPSGRQHSWSPYKEDQRRMTRRLLINITVARIYFTLYEPLSKIFRARIYCYFTAQLLAFKRLTLFSADSIGD